MLFLIFFYYGIKASIMANSKFQASLTFAMTSMLAIFTFIGIGTAAALLPPLWRRGAVLKQRFQ